MQFAVLSNLEGICGLIQLTIGVLTRMLESYKVSENYSQKQSKKGTKYVRYVKKSST